MSILNRKPLHHKNVVFIMMKKYDSQYDKHHPVLSITIVIVSSSSPQASEGIEAIDILEKCSRFYLHSQHW